MHIGAHNWKSDYLIAEQRLTEVNQQRDLGILITDDLKWRFRSVLAQIYSTNPITLTSRVLWQTAPEYLHGLSLILGQVLGGANETQLFN